MKNSTNNFNYNSLATSFLKCTIAFFFFFFSLNVYGQKQDTLLKITDNVYVIKGFIANVTFLVTDEGVCLIDAGDNSGDGEKILQNIKSVTNKPLKYIIVTHHHFDHVGGLSAMPKTIKVISHKNVTDHLKNAEKEREYKISALSHLTDSLKTITKNKKGVEFQKIDSLISSYSAELNRLGKEKAIYPNLLIDSLNKIVLGKDTIDLIYPGKAHTNGDLVVNIKSKHVVVLGDLLFNKCWSYIDLSGDVENWSKQLKNFSEYNARCFVPGHADLANKEDVTLFSNYLNDIYTLVKNYKDQGKTVEEIKTLVKLPAYDEYGFKDSRDMNVESIFKQLKP